MRQVRFNLTTVEDMNAYALFSYLEELFNLWSRLIDEGYIIVLYRDFADASSEVVERITTKNELNEFTPRFLPT